MTIAENYDGFIFDLDGTVYRGTNLIQGADLTINYLKQNNKKIIFISNKTTGSIDDYYNLLFNYGINLSPQEIVTATVTIKKYLAEEHFGKKFFAVGEKLFISEIIESGLEYSENPSEIEVVLVTLDRFINKEKILLAAEALKNGASFFAANIDMTCPVEDGEIVDAGTTILELEKLTGRSLEKHFGKPSMYMMNEISKRICIPRNRLLLIGDRLETDIKMAGLYGIDSALVSTGVSSKHLNNTGINPTYSITSVCDLLSPIQTA